MSTALTLAIIADGNIGLFDSFLNMAAIGNRRACELEQWWRWTAGLAVGVTIARLRHAVP